MENNAMARMARIVVPGVPYHVTQRGNRRQTVFFDNSDYRLYRRLLNEQCERCALHVWAYCLMPNHVHLIVVPAQPDSLRRAIGEAHRRDTQHINAREGWCGYLWQGRFASFPMDERYVLAAARYIAFNPVRAKLCDSPGAWPWSSTRAHLLGRDDELVKVAPLLAVTGDWRRFLTRRESAADLEALQHHVRTGRPLGDESFIDRLEQLAGRNLRKQKPGRQAVASLVPSAPGK